MSSAALLCSTQAAECLHRLFHHRLNGCFVGDIDDQRDRLAACGSDLFHDSFNSGGIDVGNSYRGSLLSKSLDGCAAYAAPTPGNDHDFVDEPLHVTSLSLRTLTGHAYALAPTAAS